MKSFALRSKDSASLRARPISREFIRAKMLTCNTVIALISENYYSSAFCMCELGAVWVLAKNFFPILIPPVDFKDLRGALTGMQCRKLTDPATASALYTRLSPLVDHPVPIERWDLKKEVFYKNLASVLDGLPKPKVVKIEEMHRVEKERDAAKALNIELEEESSKKDLELKRLYAAKDAKEVSDIRKEFSSEWEQYQDLVDACSQALGRVRAVIREALFYWTRGEYFVPNADWFDAVEKARENEELVEAHSGNFDPNEERPAIRNAMDAINGLRDFLSESSPELHKMVQSKIGDTADIRRRGYWEAQLL